MHVVVSVSSRLISSPANGRKKKKVYICGGANWAAPCDVLHLGTSGTCYTLPNTWWQNVGSIGPDRGAICRLFDDTTNPCTGSGLAILSYPGDSNLFDGAAAGRKARYISCHTCTNCT
ncbi:hypothetical protein B0H67DRAFT_498211 [Lasiosphaeris hirsuta]|uniref:Uncharacterized protein n=1 Tax=Lasiosphaeris hirsuta TaxID=260670 RepID=A0AA39ZVN3_9PEZI|nr:hypothetical protein B0H67DRAFT_498211 [Lasiosphaeris hirsuta]